MFDPLESRSSEKTNILERLKGIFKNPDLFSPMGFIFLQNLKNLITESSGQDRELLEKSWSMLLSGEALFTIRKKDFLLQKAVLNGSAYPPLTTFYAALGDNQSQAYLANSEEGRNEPPLFIMFQKFSPDRDQPNAKPVGVLLNDRIPASPPEYLQLKTEIRAALVELAKA